MLRIHGVPVSVHTRKVIVAAIQKDVPFDNEPVIPFRPPENWQRLSPTGKIPAITAGALTLADSSVICAWLERVHPQPPIYPGAADDYAMALWFEEYADGTLFRDVIHPLFFHLYVKPNILKETTDRAMVETTLGQALPRCFGYLEGALSGDWFAGGGPSIADIAIGSNLVNYHYLGFTLDAQRWPRLADFFGRITRLPAMHAALRAEQPTAGAMGLDRGFLDHVPHR